MNLSIKKLIKLIKLREFLMENKEINPESAKIEGFFTP